MMQKTTKMMSALLSVLLLAGIVPATVFAAEKASAVSADEPAATETQQEENVSKAAGTDFVDNTSNRKNTDTGEAAVPTGGNVTIDLDSLLDLLFSDENGKTFSLNGQEFGLDGIMEAFTGAASSVESETEDHADYAEMNPTEPAKTAKTGRINCYSLNIRTGSSTGHPIIGQLYADDEVEVIGEENGWYQVAIPEKTGYVSGKYLDVTESRPELSAQTVEPDGFDEEFLKLFLALMMQGIGTEQEPETAAGLTPDGNLTLVDDIKPAAEQGQQFITVVTKAGNYFYLVIDRDDNGNENVHFLNMVDEADLLALMDGDETEKPADTPEQELPAQTESEKETEDPSDLESEKDGKKGINPMPILLVLLLAAAGGGGYFFLQIKKKKQAALEKPDPDADYMDVENDDEFELPDDMDEETDLDDDSFDDMEPI